MLGQRGLEIGQEIEHTTYELLRDATLTGLTVVVPVVVTLYVLGAALNLVLGAFDPLIDLLDFAGVGQNVSETFIKILGVATLAGIIFVTGFLTRFRSGQRVIDYFDHVLTAVPGVGSVYSSFRRMGDVMLESDEQNFRDVKLLEFPQEGIYTLGFETTHTPEQICEAVGEEGMETIFLPFAPNPVMGGFLAHVPSERVHDVDMSVEEGLTTVMTTGVATASTEREIDELPQSSLEQLGKLRHTDFGSVPDSSQTEKPEEDSVPTDGRDDDGV